VEVKATLNYAGKPHKLEKRLSPGIFWVLPSREAAETAFKKNPVNSVQ
jgi:hypothetical protein